MKIINRQNENWLLKGSLNAGRGNEARKSPRQRERGKSKMERRHFCLKPLIAKATESLGAKVAAWSWSPLSKPYQADKQSTTLTLR
jgi:hypothetical protein